MLRCVLFASALLTGVCAQAQDLSPAPLENTYWKLLRLNGKAVQVAKGQLEPHLILQPLQKRAVGFSGCQRMQGSYTYTAQQLTVQPFAGKRMACPQENQRTLEHAYLVALEHTVRWRIHGQHLMLLSAKGRIMAEFEAVYLQ